MAAAVSQEPEGETPLEQLFTDLPCATVDTVMADMSLESACRKSDWRALASVLGFSGRQVQLMQQDKRQHCKGRLLVEVWEDLGKSSLQKFIYALKEARMEECYRTITQDPLLEGEFVMDNGLPVFGKNDQRPHETTPIANPQYSTK
jgi:hypothetical protein